MQEWLDHIKDTDYTDCTSASSLETTSSSAAPFWSSTFTNPSSELGTRSRSTPPVEGATTRPDFLAERDRERLYIEAIAPGSSPAAKAVAQRRAVLFD